MERPALTKLLEAVQQGWIDVIAVYKMDRLSRLLADYVRLVELIDRAIREDFILPAHRDLIVVESDPSCLLDRLATHQLPDVRRWLKRDEI